VALARALAGAVAELDRAVVNKACDHPHRIRHSGRSSDLTPATTRPAWDWGWPMCPAAILVRLRSGRCFYADPPPRVATGKGGRPRRHGAKLDTGNPSTWLVPTASHIEDDDQYGRVHVQAWAGLHPKQQLHDTRGTKQPRPIVRGTLVRLQVQRVPAHRRCCGSWRRPSSIEPRTRWPQRAHASKPEHDDSDCEADIGVDDEGLDPVKWWSCPDGRVSRHRWKAAGRRSLMADHSAGCIWAKDVTGQ
jgi:hypothetical protein